MAEIVYLDSPLESEALFERLCPPVRQWFKDKFPDFTRPQKLAIPAIMDKQHLLLCSPTGSGKTLTAFLTVIDQLVRLALEKKLEKKVHAIYISPIKALANDIQRNLIGPLNEITEKYLPDRAQEIRVGLRTGDTSQSDRQKMLRNPPHILITTPESLAIAITSPRFQPIVSEVEYMIIDELHSMVSTKRGVHLSLTLSLLDSLLKNPVQRIGISATMEPLETVAEYLVSSDDREARGQPTSVSIAKISGSRELDLDILITHPKFSDLSMVKVLEYNIEASRPHQCTYDHFGVRQHQKNDGNHCPKTPALPRRVGRRPPWFNGQEHPLGCGKETQVRPFACRCNLVFTRNGY